MQVTRSNVLSPIVVSSGSAAAGNRWAMTCTSCAAAAEAVVQVVPRMRQLYQQQQGRERELRWPRQALPASLVRRRSTIGSTRTATEYAHSVCPSGGVESRLPTAPCFPARFVRDKEACGSMRSSLSENVYASPTDCAAALFYPLHRRSALTVHG